MHQSGSDYHRRMSVHNDALLLVYSIVKHGAVEIILSIRFTVHHPVIKGHMEQSDFTNPIM